MADTSQNDPTNGMKPRAKTAERAEEADTRANTRRAEGQRDREQMRGNRAHRHADRAHLNGQRTAEVHDGRAAVADAARVAEVAQLHTVHAEHAGRVH